MYAIEFSSHIKLKIELLKLHGIEFSEEIITDCITNPDRINRGYKGRLIAQKRIDDRRVLRVIYEKHEDKIVVVTAYPGKRSRYEKN